MIKILNYDQAVDVLVQLTGCKKPDIKRKLTKRSRHLKNPSFTIEEIEEKRPVYGRIPIVLFNLFIVGRRAKGVTAGTRIKYTLTGAAITTGNERILKIAKDLPENGELMLCQDWQKERELERINGN